MEIAGKEYKSRIEPRFGKVRAELFYIWNNNGNETEIHLISKEFGSMFRSPKEEDYKKAKKWADEQLKCIFIANK